MALTKPQAWAHEDGVHLLRCAQALALTAPSMARFFVAQMREKTAQAGLTLDDAAAGLFCRYCSTVLVPGVNCRVRVRTRMDSRVRATAVMDPVPVSVAVHTPKAGSSSTSSTSSTTPTAATPKAMAALSLALPGVTNCVSLYCDTCARAATTLPGTERAWRAHERIKKRRLQQSTSTKKKQLKTMLRTSAVQPARIRPAHQLLTPTDHPHTPIATPSLFFQFQCDESNAAATSRVDPALRPTAASVAPPSTSPPTRIACSAATTTTTAASSSRPVSADKLLDLRAKELKAARKQMQLQQHATPGPSTTTPFSFSAHAHSAHTASAHTATAVASAPRAVVTLPSASPPTVAASPFSFASIAAASKTPVTKAATSKAGTTPSVAPKASLYNLLAELQSPKP
jgi:RNase P subunit RPR2